MTVPARQTQTAGGRWIRPTEKKAGADVSPAAQTSTYTSPQFNIEDAIEIDAQFNVTAISGTSPTAALKLQCSQDGTTWFDVPPANLVALTAVGTQNASFVCPGVYGRWVVTIGGTTPSVTFNIDHQAVPRV